MTRTEERLRSAFAGAAETVRPGTLRPLTVPAPDRPRTRRWIVPLIAAASVGTVIAGTVAVRDHAYRDAARPPSGVSTPVGVAERSVVKINATASPCSRRLEGTGFVYAPQRVMTAAHIVGGSRGPVEVSVPARHLRYQATVVVYDPRRDVAVLAVPGLRVPSLTFRPAAVPGAAAVIAGYPHDASGLTAATARVRARQTASGPDLYRSAQVRREILAVRTTAQVIAPGAPLLATDGTVYGLVFAAALDDAHTAYALTAREIGDDARAGRTVGRPVSTQGCTG